MLQFKLFITCQMLLSSGSSFCARKKNAETVDRWCNTPIRTIFNNAKPAYQRRETVEIAEITKYNRTLVHNKGNNQRNAKITGSEIRFSGFSQEALVFDEF